MQEKTFDQSNINNNLSIQKYTLKDFFEAKSVAVIGASTKPNSPGYIIAMNFVHSFEGDVYFVNPKGGRLFTKKLYPSVLDIPDQVDLAVIIVPARFVPQVVEECGLKGIHLLIIISGGFSEVGEEGAKLEHQIKELAKKFNLRIIGPNCVGIYAPKSKLDTIFLPHDLVKRPGFGPMSFFTQSGAFGVSILTELAFLGYGKWVSKFLSFGNATDINETDALEYLGSDPSTKVILGYMEGFRNPRKFLEIAKEVAKTKPIILIKANRTKAGAKAGASHTASLASDDKITDSLLKSVGIIRSESWGEMLAAAKLFATCSFPRGNKVAVVTNGGGLGVMLSDALEFEGLELAELSSETVDFLKDTFPPLYVTTNPIDLTGNSRSEDFDIALRTVVKDPSVDAIFCCIVPVTPVLDLADLVSRIQRLAKENIFAEKPLLFVSLGGEGAVLLRNKIESIGFPTFSLPETAAKALGDAWRYIQYLKKHDLGVPPCFS